MPSEEICEHGTLRRYCGECARAADEKRAKRDIGLIVELAKANTTNARIQAELHDLAAVLTDIARRARENADTIWPVLCGHSVLGPCDNCDHSRRCDRDTDQCPVCYGCTDDREDDSAG